MKKPFKILLVLIGILAAVIIAASVAIHLLLPPEKVKALIEKQIAEKLHRQVKLGAVSVGLFSGLQVDTFQLSEAPDFSKGTFISSDKLVVQVRLLPLLSKKIFVKDVELVKPDVTIVRYADGSTYNFSSLMNAAATNPAAAPAAPQAARPASDDRVNSLAFLVSRAAVTNGHLRFNDQSPAQQSAEIESLNLKVKNFTLNALMDLETSLQAKTKGVSVDVKFVGAVSMAGAAKIRELTISNGDAKITASGNVENALNPNSKLALNVDVSNFDPKLLSSFAPLPAGMRLEGPLNAKATLSGTIAALEFDANFNLDKNTVIYPDTLNKPVGVPLQLALAGTVLNKTDLNLKAAKITLATVVISASGSVQNLTATPKLQLKWNTNEFALADLQRYVTAMSLPAEIKTNGTLSLSGSVNGTSSAADFTADGDATKLELAYTDLFKKPAGVSTHFNTAGRYTTPTAAEIKSLELSVGQLTLNGSGVYKAGKPSGTYWFAFKTDRFPLAEVSGWVPMMQAYALTGGAHLDARVASGKPEMDASGTLALSDVGLKYEKAQITKLGATAAFTMDTLSIPQINGMLDGAPLKGSVTGKKLKTHPVIVSNFDIQTLNLSNLISDTPAPAAKASAAISNNATAQPGSGAAASAPSAAGAGTTVTQQSPAASASTLIMDVSGQLTAAHVKHDYLNADGLDVKWNLTDVTTDLAKVNGTASMKQGKGNITNLQKLTADSKAAKIVFLPLTLVQKISKKAGGKLPSMDQLPFKSVVGDYTFKSGVLSIAKFVLDSDQFSADMTGTVGLAGAQPLDLKAAFKLAAGVLGGSVGEILKDDQGRASVGFFVKGTVDSPDVKPDVAALGKQLINGIKNGVGSSFLKKLGIPVPASSTPSEQPAPANSSSNAPADQNGSTEQSAPAKTENKQEQQIKDLQNIFKGIFKK